MVLQRWRFTIFKVISGHALVHAIIARDVPMIQGTALVMGGLFVVLNMLADLLNAWIDPRIREGGTV